MIDNSWAWAKAHGKIRIHPVHKREEARLVLTDWFEDKEQHGEERTLKGEARIQDLKFSAGVDCTYLSLLSYINVILDAG